MPKASSKVKTQAKKKDSMSIKCFGCGTEYKVTREHLHGSFWGYCTEECFVENGK